MVKCPRCGYDNISSSTYCVNCSYVLNASTTTQEKSGWKRGTVKKIALIIGIIAIALVLFSVIYNYTQPSHEESLNVVVADNNVQQGSSHPYELRIICAGDWYFKGGIADYPQEQSGYGNQTISLDAASWDSVYVLVERSTDSSDNITIQLLRNGDVVAENATTATQATLSYRS